MLSSAVVALVLPLILNKNLERVERTELGEGGRGGDEKQSGN